MMRSAMMKMLPMLAVATAVSVRLLAAQEAPPPGFAAIFNGTDLTGWKVPEGDNGHWKVTDGVIDYDAHSEAASDKSLWTREGVRRLHPPRRVADEETPFTNPDRAHREAGRRDEDGAADNTDLTSRWRTSIPGSTFAASTRPDQHLGVAGRLG